VHCGVNVENPRFMSDPACSSICRDRRHRHRNLTHYAVSGIMGLMPRAGLCRIEF
jgi:hypothetical protein